MDDKGICEHCGQVFEYRLFHNGFNESAYAYCDKCGRLAILDGWKIPVGKSVKCHQAITPNVEQELLACECGGCFRANAYPRCPRCHRKLSAENAIDWIEKNAPGTSKGWRWQRNWTGIYAICIENNLVEDNWK